MTLRRLEDVCATNGHSTEAIATVAPTLCQVTTTPQPASLNAASPVRCRIVAQWQTYTIEVEVPDNADSIVIGLALAGNGAAWFGDLELGVC